MPITFTTAIDTNRSITSHTKSISSSSIRVIAFNLFSNSYSSPITSSTKRLASFDRPIDSYTKTLSSNSSRGPASYVPRQSESHSGTIVTFSYNERTSLELIDYTVKWDDDKAVWYTPWVTESKVLGREDRFVLKAKVAEGAKDPAATITIQYDDNGNGNVTQESDSVRVGKKEEIKEIDDIPIRAGGCYRMKIDEYSGYNSLISLDMGIVN